MISQNVLEERPFWSYPSVNIKQGYIPTNPKAVNRVRSIRRPNGETDYFFTFKRKTKNRLVELEMPIDERDFKDLWDVCSDKLCKTRHFVDEWEFDIFFEEDGTPYFTLLEYECEEGTPRPELPEMFKKYLLLDVALTDNRFSSKNLSNIGYAKSIYKEVSRDGTEV